MASFGTMYACHASSDRGVLHTRHECLDVITLSVTTLFLLILFGVLIFRSVLLIPTSVVRVSAQEITIIVGGFLSAEGWTLKELIHTFLSLILVILCLEIVLDLLLHGHDLLVRVACPVTLDEPAI